jgi:hypothetical protein
MSEETGIVIPAEDASSVTLDAVRAELLKLGAKCPMDQILTARQHVQVMLDRVKNMKTFLEACMLEWIIENHADIVCGEVRWYAGTAKTVKCHNIPGALEALMVATEGDFSKLCEVLSSNAIKQGAAKKILRDDWNKFFTVAEEQDLKEGKPVKSLQTFNTAFQR